MDKTLIRRRFSKAVPTYPGQADVQQRIALRMVRLIKKYVPASRRRRVVEVGCGTGTFTRPFLQDEFPESLLLNDLCPEVEPGLKDVLCRGGGFCAGDAEQLDFPPDQDLFVSCSAIQWFDHPDDFFVKCHRHLSAGGCWAFSTFGPRNLEEIAALTDAGLPYRSREELNGSLRLNYQLLYSREEVIRMTFPSPMDVLKHLKETGVTGTGNWRWTRRSLAEFCEQYVQRFSLAGGGVSLTYHPIYMIARKTEDSCGCGRK